MEYFPPQIGFDAVNAAFISPRTGTAAHQPPGHHGTTARPHGPAHPRTPSIPACLSSSRLLPKSKPSPLDPKHTMLPSATSVLLRITVDDPLLPPPTHPPRGPEVAVRVGMAAPPAPARSGGGARPPGGLGAPGGPGLSPLVRPRHRDSWEAAVPREEPDPTRGCIVTDTA